jgi:hypothetical protein
MNTSATLEETSISSSHSMAAISRWFVEQQQFRRNRQCLRQRQPFFLPAGQRADQGIRIEREALDDPLGLRLERPGVPGLELALQGLHPFQQPLVVGTRLA